MSIGLHLYALVHKQTLNRKKYKNFQKQLSKKSIEFLYSAVLKKSPIFEPFSYSAHFCITSPHMVNTNDPEKINGVYDNQKNCIKDN